MGIDFSHIASQIIAFLVMLWILSRYGWKPVLQLLDERHAKIKAEFDEIAQQKNEVNQLIGEYKQKLQGIDATARQKIQEAISSGQKIAVEIQADCQRQAKEILAQAQTEVGEEILKARSQLKNDVINMALKISERILKEKLDEQGHMKLIADVVKEAELK